MNFSLRPARKSDCRRIAELYRISSDGVADYIWTRLASPGEDILEVGRRRYEREGTLFSYQNCKLVDRNGEILGMVVAFPMKVDPEYVETVFEQNAGAKRLYERAGYNEKLRHAVVPHPLIHYTGDALLMVKHLEPPR